MNENEKRIKDQCDMYSKFFIERLRRFPTEDHSKHFIIFIYNYRNIGLDDEAREMVPYITDDYLRNKLVTDMQHAIDNANKAKELQDKGKVDEAAPYGEAAEYFICAAGVLKFLSDVGCPGMVDVLEQLKDKKFGLDSSFKGTLQ